MLAVTVRVVTSPPRSSLPTWEVSAGGITIFARPPSREVGDASPPPAGLLDVARANPRDPVTDAEHGAARGTPAPPERAPDLVPAPLAAPPASGPELPGAGTDPAGSPGEAVETPALPAPVEAPDAGLTLGPGGRTTEASPDGARNRPPAYPPQARRERREGTVILLVRVEADGSVRSCAVATSSGHSLLDEAALRAVRRWRFTPARLDGRPVPARVLVPVRFQLER